MTIILVGGGTGGHITPILAVAHELKQLDPTLRIVYIGEKNAKFAHLLDGVEAIDAVHTIYAGKFRRYHGESLFTKIVDVKTNLLNIRDLWYTAIGMLQAVGLVRKLRGDVLFAKGGFVCVPIGLAAALWRVPLVTHDSDSIPGLANRIIGRFAARHATGMPTDLYGYPAAKAVYTGIPLAAGYQLVTETMQAQARAALQLPKDAVIILVTGGSLGAQRLNIAFARVAFDLLAAHRDLWIIHQVGKGNLGDYNQSHDRLVVTEYLSGMHDYSAAADIVVARAGATTIAELAVQAKPTILVPNPYLTGGHQVSNARYLAERDMMLMVEESQLNTGLEAAVTQLLNNPSQRKQLQLDVQAAARPHAARDIAKVLTGFTHEV